MRNERSVRENQRIQGSLRTDGDIARRFFFGDHNIITVKTAQYLLFRRFYRQGIQIKVIGVDYTGSILFTGLGDSNLSVGGHFQYVFPNTEGGVLNYMITTLICPICPCDCGLYLFLLSAGQLSLGGQSDIPPCLTGLAAR